MMTRRPFAFSSAAARSASSRVSPAMNRRANPRRIPVLAMARVKAFRPASQETNERASDTGAGLLREWRSRRPDYTGATGNLVGSTRVCFVHRGTWRSSMHRHHRRLRFLVPLSALAVALLAGGSLLGRCAAQHANHGAAPSGTDLPVFTGLGGVHHPISTRSPETQRFFDQGLRLAYAFNHDEAIRSFEKAASIDSTCAMCWWGIGLALGPNINNPMSPEAEQRAAAALERARALAAHATDEERAYIG